MKNILMLAIVFFATTTLTSSASQTAETFLSNGCHRSNAPVSDSIAEKNRPLVCTNVQAIEEARLIINSAL